jgi:hypothetical protein
MIIVRAARLDCRGVGAVDSGRTHPPGDDFVIPGTHPNSLSTGQPSWYGITVNAPAPEASSQFMSPFSPHAPASAAATESASAPR